jgi:membrane-bound serine protease (ClpP class)
MDEIILPVILMAVGLVAFFLEVFVPSGGVITIFGLGAVGAAVWLAFTRAGSTTGVVFLGVALILVPASLIGAIALLPRTRWGRRLTLSSRQSAETGYVAQDASEKDLIGKRGVALSSLRPSGEARIDDRRFDVITEGEMIEKDVEIEVRAVGGNRIVVRRVREESDKT